MAQQVFKGTADQIENNTNKVKTINSGRNDTEYPSAKAVYDYCEKDITYNPNSDKLQTGKTVAQALSHYDTVFEQGNEFIFDGGLPGEAFETNLTIDSILDAQSKNPVQNKTLTEKTTEIETQLNKNTNIVNNFDEHIDTLNTNVDLVAKKETQLENKHNALDERVTTNTENITTNTNNLNATTNKLDNYISTTKDRIIEQGSVGALGQYRKYESGILEYWDRGTNSSNKNISYKGISFINNPIVTLNVENAYYQTLDTGQEVEILTNVLIQKVDKAFVGVVPYRLKSSSPLSQTDYMPVEISYRNSFYEPFNYSYSIHAIGRWK